MMCLASLRTTLSSPCPLTRVGLIHYSHTHILSYITGHLHNTKRIICTPHPIPHAQFSIYHRTPYTIHHMLFTIRHTLCPPGLCGGVNSILTRMTRQMMQRLDAAGKKSELLVLGEKGRAQLRRYVYGYWVRFKHTSLKFTIGLIYTIYVPYTIKSPYTIPNTIQTPCTILRIPYMHIPIAPSPLGPLPLASWPLPPTVPPPTTSIWHVRSLRR
ncbi:hypothetical protein EON63_06520 [archaeon]|nr:MAG: hypothetical protein EON63_06520 [archaeon]